MYIHKYTRLYTPIHTQMRCDFFFAGLSLSIIVCHITRAVRCFTLCEPSKLYPTSARHPYLYSIAFTVIRRFYVIYWCQFARATRVVSSYKQLATSRPCGIAHDHKVPSSSCSRALAYSRTCFFVPSRQGCQVHARWSSATSVQFYANAIIACTNTYDA